MFLEKEEKRNFHTINRAATEKNGNKVMFHFMIATGFDFIHGKTFFQKKHRQKRVVVRRKFKKTTRIRFGVGCIGEKMHANNSMPPIGTL